MFGFSFGELLVISLVTLVAVGPQKLPGMLKTMGQWARKLRKMTMDVRQQTGIDEMLRAEGIQISELRSLMRGYHGGVAAPVAPAPAPAPAPVRPSYEDPYANVEPDPTREYPPEGADAYGALPDDLLEPAPPKKEAELPAAAEPAEAVAAEPPAAVPAAAVPAAAVPPAAVPAAAVPAAAVPPAAEPAAAVPAAAEPAAAQPAAAEPAAAEPAAAVPAAAVPAAVVPAAAPPPPPTRTAPPPPPSSRPVAVVPRPSGTPPPPPRRTAPPPPPPRPEPSSPVNPPAASGTGTTNGNG